MIEKRDVLDFAIVSLPMLDGQLVVSLVDDVQTAGYNTVTWDASDFSAGMYIHRLQAGSSVETKRMLLIQ